MTATASSPARRLVDRSVAEPLLDDVVATGRPVDVVAPATGEPWLRLPQSTADDVADAFRLARAAQPAWAARPVRERAAVARRLHDLVLARRAEVLDVIQSETGKARGHAVEEVLETAMAAEYAGRHAAGWLRPRRRADALPVFTHAVETPVPHGTVVVITPWNYPLALAADVVPALLAGNTVVHKPDNQTALSALWLRRAMIECGLPPQAWQVVLGAPEEIGDALIADADFVAFTGSTAAGRRIARAAGERLIGCSLELGGKNPMLVLDDADLDRAARLAVRACFANAGQLCVGIERVYVQRPVFDAFLTRFAGLVGAQRLGTGLDFSADLGSLTSRAQLERVQAQLAQAVAAGATVVTGGRARPDVGPFVHEPTVLTGVPPTAALYREETFGPLAAVYPFGTDEEGIALANDSCFGLNASVIGGDVARARRVARRIRAGMVNVNEGYASSYGSQGAPMGGMKDSGLGRRHGRSGVLKFTEPQTVATQRLLGFDPALGMDAETYARFLAVGMRTLKALRIR